MYIEKKMEEIPKQYDGDIRRYKEYCCSTGQVIGTEAMLDYLYISLTEQQIKKTTWECRLAAIRKYLNVIHKINSKEKLEWHTSFQAYGKCIRKINTLI